MADRTMLTKLVLDASSYQKGVQTAKLATQQINKELELWKTQNKAAGDSAKYLSEQLKAQKQQASVLAAEMQVTEKRLQDVTAAQGAGSKEALAAKNKLLDLQIQQEKLNQSIAKASGPLENFKNHLNDISGSLKKAGDSMMSAGKNLTMGVTMPIVGAATAAVKFASDLEESTNKVDVAFGVSAKGVKDWSETTLESYGIAKGSALDMAALFGDMATSMGMSTGASAQMSQSLVGLAGDLASFKNIGIEEAQTALKSIFTGETESLKNLGIVMTQANLNAYALAQGMGKTVQQMSQAEQVQLRYNYVMEMTKNAQGDFARTSEGTANQLRIFKESTKELAAEMGQNLLPLITPIIKKVNEWVQAFAKMDKGTQEMIVKVALIAAAIGPALFMIGGMTKGVGALMSGVGLAASAIGKLTGANKILTTSTAASTAANKVFATSVATTSAVSLPLILGIAAGAAALGAAAYLLYKNWEKVPPFFKAAWEVIKNAFGTYIAGIMVYVRTLQVGLTSLIDFIGGNLLDAFSKMLGIFAKVPVVGDAFKAAQSGVESFRGSIKGLADNSKKDLADAIANAKSAASGTADSWNKLTKAGAELGKGIASTAKDVVGKVKEMVGLGPKALENTMDDYDYAGAEAAQAYADGIASNSAEVVKAAKEMAEKARDAAISAVNKLNDSIVAALQRRYKAEEKLQTNSLKKQASELDSWKDTQIKRIEEVREAALTALDNETNQQVNALQAQIDALDAQLDAEEKAKQEKEELDNIASLKAKLAATADAEAREQIQADLNEAIADRNERLHQEEIDRLKDSLRAQIAALENTSAQKKKQLELDAQAQITSINNQYTAQKNSLDQQLSDLQAFYDDRLSQASLAAEAEKQIMGNNQVEIAALLKTYGNLYEDSGKSLGERLLAGIKSYTTLIPSLVTAGQVGVQTLTGGGSSLNEHAQYIQDTYSGGLSAYIASLDARAAAGTEENIVARVTAEKERLGIPSYDVGTPYVPKDMLAFVHKGEQIIPAAANIQQSKNTPQITINFNSPVYGVLDFEQRIKQIVRDAARNGGFRGVLAGG